MINAWVCAVNKPVSYPAVCFFVCVEPLCAPWMQGGNEWMNVSADKLTCFWSPCIVQVPWDKVLALR